LALAELPIAVAPDLLPVVGLALDPWPIATEFVAPPVPPVVAPVPAVVDPLAGAMPPPTLCAIAAPGIAIRPIADSAGTTRRRRLAAGR